MVLDSAPKPCIVTERSHPSKAVGVLVVVRPGVYLFLIIVPRLGPFFFADTLKKEVNNGYFLRRYFLTFTTFCQETLMSWRWMAEGSSNINSSS